MSRALVAVPLLCAVLALPAAAAATDLTAAQWREDLAVLDEAIRTVHGDPFHTVREADHTAAVQALHDAIPSMDDRTIIVELAAIIAAVNDGHTGLRGWLFNPTWGFASYPLSFFAFEDGYRVRQAHPDHADLVGARLTHVGTFAVDEAMTRVGRVTTADNPHGRRHNAVTFLRARDVLIGLGLIGEDDTAPFTFEKDGRNWKPELATAAHRIGFDRGFVAPSEGYVDAMTVTGDDVPLWRRHPDRTFWFEVLADEKILYVQNNQIRHAGDETQDAFWARVWSTFQSQDIDTVVLDVRLNGGGNNYLNAPALTTMVKMEDTAQTYTIIGPQTFSACQNLVNELSRWTRTIFVGEPTGERANFWGDTRSIELPHSGLVARISWLWWQNMDPRDTRDALYPDLAAPLTIEDYAAGIDPAMDVVRRGLRPLDAATLHAQVQRDGVEATLANVRAAHADPAYRHASIETALNDLGYRLLQARDVDAALVVFETNVAMHPASWNVWDSLGEALEVAGRRDEALEHFERSLELNPDSPTGREAVARLRS